MAWVMAEEQDPSNDPTQQNPGANGLGVVVLNQWKGSITYYNLK
jgi:hypothetical protein